MTSKQKKIDELEQLLEQHAVQIKAELYKVWYGYAFFSPYHGWHCFFIGYGACWYLGEDLKTAIKKVKKTIKEYKSNK